MLAKETNLCYYKTNLIFLGRIMDIHLVKGILSSLSGLGFERISNKKGALLEYFNLQSNGLFKSLYKSYKDLEHFCNLESGIIYEYSWFFGATYIAFWVEKEKHIYVIGPSLNQSFSESQAIKLLRDKNIPKQIEKELLLYGASMPVVSSSAINRLALLLYRSFSNGKINVKNQTIDMFLHNSTYSIPSTYNKEISMRKVEERYELSSALTQAVKQGNYSLAMSLLGTASASGVTARNSSPLRNAQNYCIIMNTQFRHALQECNIHPFVLDRVSDEIGVKIEQLTSVKTAHEMMLNILKTYCKLVQDNTYPQVKPLIKLAITYIKDHLTEEVTVKDTAKALMVNPNYLSTVFAKEMGESFIEFVNKQRIKQATSLLKYTTMQVQEIAYAVGYNNTSYFAKVFMKEYKKSPRQYRLDL